MMVIARLIAVGVPVRFVFCLLWEKPAPQFRAFVRQAANLLTIKGLLGRFCALLFGERRQTSSLLPQGLLMAVNVVIEPGQGRSRPWPPMGIHSLLTRVHRSAERLEEAVNPFLLPQ